MGVSSAPKVTPSVAAALAKSREEIALDEDDVTALLTARGPDAHAVAAAADSLRREVNGDTVTYVVTRNVNYTNVCYFRCGFCAFSKGRLAANLRGRPYLVPPEEIARRAREAWERGAVEICLQGGIHPSFTGDFYAEVCEAVKEAVPGIHVHAFSALEVWQGAATLGLALGEYLSRLRDAGLASLPGTAAEILDDEVRQVICPDKVTTEQWLHVHDTAHRAGLRSTTTIMFGHVDRPRHSARHFLRLREQQQRTGGFTEIVPLPFVHMEAPIYLKGRARQGPTFREAILLHAAARLALHPWITNVQASWVKLGVDGAQAALRAGANDLGGTLMNESISRAAGSVHGQELLPEQMEAAIRAIGRTPRQRTTLYGDPPPEQVRRSFGAAPLERAAQPERERRRPRCAAETRPPGFRRRRALDEPAAGGPRECRVRPLRRSDDRRRSRPVALTRWEADDPSTALRITGAVLIAIGGALVLETTARFALQGRGTPAPFAAPERFVARGSYRVVRNPMYVGVLALIVGQALLLGPRGAPALGRRRGDPLPVVRRLPRGAGAPQALRRRVRGLPAPRRPLAPPGLVLPEIGLVDRIARPSVRRADENELRTLRACGRAPESCLREPGRPSMAPGPRCRRRP